MNTDKFYVYLIKGDGTNCITRLWTDVQGVKDVLCKRGTNNVLTVLKSSNNQFAFLLGDCVVWMDVEDTVMSKQIETNVSF